MKHEVLKPKQREWLEWLLGDGKDWLAFHINAPENIQRIRWTCINGIYDVRTRQLLNFLLNRFNENEWAKKQWMIYNKWKVKLNDNI